MLQRALGLSMATIVMLGSACGTDDPLVEPLLGTDGKLDVNSGVTMAGPLVFGGAVVGAFEHDLEFYGYEFEGLARGVADIEVSQLGTTRELDTTLFVFGPRGESGDYGERIAMDDDSGWGLHSRISGLSLPATGTYLIVVGTHNAAGRGRYRLSLECARGTCESDGSGESGDEEDVRPAFADAASGMVACLFASGSLPASADEEGACPGSEDVNIWESSTPHMLSIDLGDITVEDHGSSWYHAATGLVGFRRDAPDADGWVDSLRTEACSFVMRAQFTDEDASIDVEGGLECSLVPRSSSDCSDRLAARLAPVVDDLWYMSEGDYPFEVFAERSVGQGQITPELVLREILWRTDRPSLVDRGDFEEWISWYADEEGGYDGDQPRYQQMRTILREELTDLTVIRIDEVQVKTFVIGRTRCGELAGLRTVSVET